jgi:hypothetical protein
VTAESQRRSVIRARPDRTLLVFHAEKLHEDPVWGRVLPIARHMSRDGVRLTFFVFPYRADAVGADLAPRVRELDRLGHEIAQHTHFYAGTSFLTDQKADDLSDANVTACIQRDADRLRAMGAEPRGFTAGAWQLPEAALETLATQGFEYDCSARHPEPAARPVNPHHRWLTEAELFRGDRGALVMLPTTCSLGGWFKWGRRVLVAGPPDYQMVYLHDYDLLEGRTRFLLTAFLRLRGARMDIDARELASDVLAAAGEAGAR